MTRLRSRPTPAHDHVLPTIRTRLDDLRELSQLLRRKARLGTLRPVVDEALQTRGVEAMDPVTQRMASSLGGAAGAEGRMEGGQGIAADKAARPERAPVSRFRSAYCPAILSSASTPSLGSGHDRAAVRTSAM